jgi:hypothetical protein
MLGANGLSILKLRKFSNTILIKIPTSLASLLRSCHPNDLNRLRILVIVKRQHSVSPNVHNPWLIPIEQLFISIHPKFHSIHKHVMSQEE